MGVSITDRDYTVAVRVETKCHVPIVPLISGASRSNPLHEFHVASDEDIGRNADQWALRAPLLVKGYVRMGLQAD